jgi:N-acetylglutamate synthase-like GNAT family acetyltransferase
MMKVRQANLQDAQSIARIASSLGYQKNVSDDLAIKRLEHVLHSDYDQIWVAEGNSEVVGWLHAQHAFRVASADFIEILGLSVSEQSRLQGVGRDLVEQAKIWALEENISLRVRTNEVRDTAKQFYSVLGFSLAKRQCVFHIPD